jgi:hypothetical protein
MHSLIEGKKTFPMTNVHASYMKNFKCMTPTCMTLFNTINPESRIDDFIATVSTRSEFYDDFYEYTTKLDVFALGVSLLMVYDKNRLITKNQPMVDEFITTIISGMVDHNPQTRFSNEEVKAKVADLLNKYPQVPSPKSKSSSRHTSPTHQSPRMTPQPVQLPMNKSLPKSIHRHSPPTPIKLDVNICKNLTLDYINGLLRGYSLPMGRDNKSTKCARLMEFLAGLKKPAKSITHKGKIMSLPNKALTKTNVGKVDAVARSPARHASLMATI